MIFPFGSRIPTLWKPLAVAMCLAAGLAQGADYGRVTGSVLDPQGNPLMGATVIIAGPVLPGLNSAVPSLERILTDAHGKFTAEDLLPGWYSLRVISPTRVPALRNGIHVEAGETAREKFVLTDIFAPIRFETPSVKLTTWGEDWKWVLRTSAATRPLMRFQDDSRAVAAEEKLPLPPSERVFGMVPGSTRREALEGDPGMGSVLAYLRPLSDDSDLLVAGALATDGTQASSLATSFRKHLLKGEPEEISLVVHQLSFGEGGALMASAGRSPLGPAQSLSAGYRHTQRVSQSVTLTSGMEVDYLNALSHVMTTRPFIQLDFQPDSPDAISVRYGTWSAEGDSSLLDRVEVLNAFPEITVRNNRPQLQTLNHAEASFTRKFAKRSRAELAVFHDEFGNVAIYGLGGPQTFAAMAGNAIPNAAPNGVTLNGGNFSSTGIRAEVLRPVGTHVEMAMVFSSGNALTLNSQAVATSAWSGGLRPALSTQPSQSVACKISAYIPKSKTKIITSYQWMEHGRLTGVDPYGQASLQLEPFLGVEIRQPLPTLAFLPAHIEALADFRNLTGQGYVPLSQGGDQVLLSPAYRSFRGGFSVKF